MTAFRHFLRNVRDVHSRKPVLVNTATFCLLYAAGDISQQTLRQTDNYDFANTARVTVAGGGFGGPFYHYWYKFLDSCLPGTTPKTIVKKVLFDQAVAGIFGTFMFYAGTNSDIYTFILLPNLIQDSSFIRPKWKS